VSSSTAPSPEAIPSQPPADPSATWALAFLSDLHLTDPLQAPELPLRLKQRLGRASWLRRRRHIHQPAVLAALAADLKAQAPRHIAIGGDLVQIGLPQEFAQAAAWLRQFAPPDQVLLVPGNHEAYVPGAWPAGRRLWQDYRPPAPGELVVQRRGELLLIGLSSALPSRPLLATGALGAAQLMALAAALERGGREGLFRVVVLHHPPIAHEVGWRKRLTDRRQFAAIIARHGAGLVLHGHAHRATRGELPGPHGAVPVIGVPAASALDPRPARMAGYGLLRVTRAGSAWRFELARRVYRPQTLDFGWQERFEIDGQG
jgi:3',5'-cyclic AMP phosphodiesterase CpdA